MNHIGCCRKVVSHAKARRCKDKALRRSWTPDQAGIGKRGDDDQHRARRPWQRSAHRKIDGNDALEGDEMVGTELTCNMGASGKFGTNKCTMTLIPL